MKNKYTGERLETDIVNNENMFEHLHRYALACSICQYKDVLDIACGEGYGTALIGKVATSVTGVDISQSAIIHAQVKYKGPNISFKHGSVTQIPLPDNSMDIIVSFETIEHLAQHAEMFTEIKRVLKPNGIILMSSPDKKYYSDLRNFKNEFHIKELYSQEFKALVKRYFSKSTFLAQQMISGSIIIKEDDISGFDLYSGDYNRVEKEVILKGMYNICLASDSNLPDLVSSCFYKDYSQLHEITVNSFKNSRRYKIGGIIVKPFNVLKKLFGN